MVAGHSFGANAAIVYAGSGREVDGMIAIAPGHVPDVSGFRNTVASSVDRAKAMIAEGKAAGQDENDRAGTRSMGCAVGPTGCLLMPIEIRLDWRSGDRTPSAEVSNRNQVKEGREMASTKDVLDHHLKCFGGGDLEGILSDYAPGAVIFTPEGPLKGVDAIRPLFKALFSEFGKPGATFSMKQQAVEGDYAYILWTAETADNVYEVGTDTFVVRDGKIVAQSFAGKITHKG